MQLAEAHMISQRWQSRCSKFCFRGSEQTNQPELRELNGGACLPAQYCVFCTEPQYRLQPQPMQCMRRPRVRVTHVTSRTGTCIPQKTCTPP